METKFRKRFSRRDCKADCGLGIASVAISPQ